MRTAHKAGLGAVAAAVIAMAVAGISPDEGMSVKPYQDIVGVWTQCKGHTEGVTAKSPVKTPKECDELLVEDVTVKYYAPLVAGIPNFSTLPVPVQSAGVRLAYNVGVSAVIHSTYATNVSQGHIRAGCEAIIKFNKAGGRVIRGLVLRRERERDQCLTGVPN